MNNKKFILCVGYTHSGKTTFARRLEKEIPNIGVVDTDRIRVFLKENYPALLKTDYHKKMGTLPLGNIIFRITKSLIEYAVESELPVVMGNGNINKENRQYARDLCDKHGYELIVVHFNLPFDLIEKRLAEKVRPMNELITSQSFTEVLEMQKGYADLEGVKAIGDQYFEIVNDDTDEVFNKVLNIFG